MKYCTQCGAELDDSPYCRTCGARTDHASGTGDGDSGSRAGWGFGGFDEKQIGLLAYITPVPALALLLIEPYSRNSFVRFHCYQCLLLTLASFVLTPLTLTLSFVYFGGLLSNLVHLLITAAWVWAAYMAWKGERWQVPIIGVFARRQADGGR